MSEKHGFYFWCLQFEVPFWHFDKMKAFRQFCLQATFPLMRQNRFFCLRPCFLTPEQKYGLKSRAISHLPLPQCVRSSSMLSIFYFHSSFCYLRMAKQAVLTRNCTLFDVKSPPISHEKFSNATREVWKVHVSRLKSPHVALAKSTWKVPFFDAFQSVQFLTLWQQIMCFAYIISHEFGEALFVPEAPTRNGLEMQHLQAILYLCPLPLSVFFPFGFYFWHYDRGSGILLTYVWEALLPIGGKEQEGSINACLSRVPLFRVKKYHGKRKKMLYHVTYCKKKAYICPSETIKTLAPAQRRDRGRAGI